MPCRAAQVCAGVSKQTGSSFGDTLSCDAGPFQRQHVKLPEGQATPLSMSAPINTTKLPL